MAGLSILIFRALTLSAQNANHLNLRTGEAVFRAACTACHGIDGKGAPDSAVGFEKPRSFPDFTQCDQTTPELDVDWKATIRDGGHGRGYSPIMPSFGESLTSEQMDLVIGYLRSFCHEKSWPRGELNLPRPLVTGKAFPEDEIVLTAAVNTSGLPDVTNELEYERRLGAKYELDLSLPYGVEPYNSGEPDQLASRTGLKLVYDARRGLGDPGFGLKRLLFSSHRSILALEGKLTLPLGPAEPRLGNGTTTFDGSVSYGQLLPAAFFLQTQAGSQRPIRTTDTPSVIYWHTAIGKSFRQGKGLGRIWSPMLEFLADRNMQPFAKTNWDLLPQLQVSLSKRQHVRASLGVQYPANNVLDRPVQVVFSILWDWFDGGLREGWK